MGNVHATFTIWIKRDFWPMKLKDACFQTSTNSIESLNRALKFHIGMGYLDLNGLYERMHSFHSKKLTEAYAVLKANRMQKK